MYFHMKCVFNSTELNVLQNGGMCARFACYCNKRRCFGMCVKSWSHLSVFFVCNMLSQLDHNTNKKHFNNLCFLKVTFGLWRDYLRCLGFDCLRI